MELTKKFIYEMFEIVEICIQSLFFILFIFILLTLTFKNKLLNLKKIYFSFNFCCIKYILK